MADNFSLMSAALHLVTPEERTWIEKYLPLVKCDADDETGSLLIELKQEAEALGMLDAWDEVQECWKQDLRCPECDFEKYRDGESKQPLWLLWIHSEDGYGSLSGLMNLIVIWMRKFQVKEPFKLQWADICSKPRLDEFGGGAVVITTQGIFWMNTAEWVDKKIKELKA